MIAVGDLWFDGSLDQPDTIGVKGLTPIVSA